MFGRALAAGLAAAFLAQPIMPASAAGVAARVGTPAAIRDLVGARTDSMLIGEIDGRLRLVDREGKTYPFGPQSSLSLIALAPLVPGDRLCPFRLNDVVVFSPAGVGGELFLVDAQGRRTRWTSIDGEPVSAAFDTTGRFGGTLLVQVVAGGRSRIDEFDCRGGRFAIPGTAATAQAGIAILPAGAGAPISGAAVMATSTGFEAFTPDGTKRTVAVAGWSGAIAAPVTGLAVVPAGFHDHGGWIGFADSRGMLKVAASQLISGIDDGDILVSSGSPARLSAVHCERGACSVQLIATSPSAGESRGRPVVVATDVESPVRLPRDAIPAGPLTWLLLGAVALSLAVSALRRNKILKPQ